MSVASSPYDSPALPQAPHSGRVAILDSGAQYTKVIDRRVRELAVPSDIYPLNTPASQLAGYSGIILSGGPHSVYDPTAPTCDPALFALPIPILGICYGMQLMNQQFGGHIAGLHHKEYGATVITVDASCPLFATLAPQQTVLMSHGDSVSSLAPGFRCVATSPALHPNEPDLIAAIQHETRPLFGLQFHPEVDLTEQGKSMLQHFLLDVCQIPPHFNLSHRLDDILQSLRQQVQNHPVFVLVSGGVDSSVVAALLLKALGPEQVYAVHMNTGLMREQESDLVCEALKAIGLKHLKRIDAEADFLNATTLWDDETLIGPLHAETDPERKRRLIGDTFVRLVEAEMRSLLQQVEAQQGKVLLAQGTLRPDLIESGNRDISQTAHKIKTHHNDVPLIQAMRAEGRVVEPNRDLHKDEVRAIGTMLGLPEALVQRQPFPGPGLGVRVLCATEPFGLDVYDELNQHLKDIAASHNLRSCLLPVRSVGVQGDGRSYSFCAALQLNDLTSPSSWSHLQQAARHIPNRLNRVNRLAVNLLSHKTLPQQLKTVTPTTLMPDVLAQLRQADALVTATAEQDGWATQISQLLTVLLPVALTEDNVPPNAEEQQKAQQRSLVIRAVVTQDFMTARPAWPGKDFPLSSLLALADQLGQLPWVSGVFYDITGKPPATVEWE